MRNLICKVSVDTNFARKYTTCRSVMIGTIRFVTCVLHLNALCIKNAGGCGAILFYQIAGISESHSKICIFWLLFVSFLWKVLMFQVRIHGRGGQGVVTAAEMLSVAAFLEGKYAQAFPSFGSERTGAPVVSFCRISDSEIRLREPISAPNAVIIQDKTVIESANAFSGIVDGGYVLINSPSPMPDLNLKCAKVSCVGATEIALENIGRPLPNAVLLGSFSALTDIIKIESVISAIKTKFSGSIAEKNVNAAMVAYDKIKSCK